MGDVSNQLASAGQRTTIAFAMSVNRTLSGDPCMVGVIGGQPTGWHVDMPVRCIVFDSTDHHSLATHNACTFAWLMDIAYRQTGVSHRDTVTMKSIYGSRGRPAVDAEAA